jgi:hypothetical protein
LKHVLQTLKQNVNVSVIGGCDCKNLSFIIL